MNEERFKSITAVLIGLVTVITIFVGFLQNDASANDDRAGRDAQVYALQALENKISGTAQVNYDYYSAFLGWNRLDTMAISAEIREDTAAAERYLRVRDQMRGLSPVFGVDYFDESSGAIDLARYESDVYLVEITRLGELFVASAAVKDEWDTKANAYVVHLTLLAVALFLYGLSTTISGTRTRWIFAGVGTAIAVYASVWAGLVYFQPVNDLRSVPGAIDSYALGVGLAYQGRYEEAISNFDQAVAAAPDYASAYIERAYAYALSGDLEAATADLERGQAAGGDSAIVAGNLAYYYYLLGRFDEAAAMNRQALEMRPDELWIQFDLAVSLLAAGQLEAARAEYDAGMAFATAQVAAAREAGVPVSSVLWWSLDDGANELDNLLTVIDLGEGSPPFDQIGSQGSDMETIRATAEDLLTELKSLSTSLELTGMPPQGELNAVISPFTFGEPIYDDNGEIIDANFADAFVFGTREIWAVFEYENMTDGDQVLIKVFIDGDEDYSLRTLQIWDQGTSGETGVLVSQTLSDAYVLASGEYRVEIYINGRLAQRGVFYIEE